MWRQVRYLGNEERIHCRHWTHTVERHRKGQKENDWEELELEGITRG